ncbi:hypothetical protein A33M_3324 [Rhodovulum sp. PH10]|uniref:hypothetical protein n=1 Tax=Rhodovulum sp. PH10 TaxID=1187851 RepID=UPI00027C2922|nr:hypothetical protein [Rhodovulum sp. PH10]EJW11246.1 hypothetical protein A33M_3324 [Rhodovulum sp. PH10]
MGIFDIFTGDSAKEAAEQNAALYAQYGRDAQGYLDTGQADALGAISSGETKAADAITSGTTSGVNAINSGLSNQIGALDTGLANANTAYGNAVSAYSPLTDLGSKYGSATSLYLDALGVNGADAAAAAQSAYTESPGYQYQVDQATDAAARKAASLGLAASGNTLSAISSQAQNIANTEYNSYLDRLAGFVNPELSATSGAASGIAGAYGQQAGTATTDAANRASAYGTAAQNTANLYGTEGTNLGNLYSGNANTTAGIYGNTAQSKANVAGNVASGTANSNTAAANAEMQGSGAFWGALANLGKAFVTGGK